MARNINRAITKSVHRKSATLEHHMKAFEQALLEQVESELLVPLRELVAAYKVNAEATLEEKIKYFEKILTPEKSPDIVIPQESQSDKS